MIDKEETDIFDLRLHSRSFISAGVDQVLERGSVHTGMCMLRQVHCRLATVYTYFLSSCVLNKIISFGSHIYAFSALSVLFLFHITLFMFLCCCWHLIVSWFIAHTEVNQYIEFLHFAQTLSSQSR